ncbi:ASCH domain-containing protein [Thermovorax subterraneus]|nr:ASCH domain-containing protein [Thermovorax subterraneus]
MEYVALAVQQPFATAIIEGMKKIELRSWKTNYRGTLLICATKRPVVVLDDGEVLPTGCALGTVELVDIRPFTPKDVKDAWADEWQPGLWAWVLKKPRIFKRPIPVSCRQRLFKVQISDDELM